MIGNSWRGYDWYGLDFGTRTKPQQIGNSAVQDYFAQRHVYIEVCTPHGDVRLFSTVEKTECETIAEKLEKEFTKPNLIFFL